MNDVWSTTTPVVVATKGFVALHRHFQIGRELNEY